MSKEALEMVFGQQDKWALQLLSLLSISKSSCSAIRSTSWIFSSLSLALEFTSYHSWPSVKWKLTIFMETSTSNFFLSHKPKFLSIENKYRLMTSGGFYLGLLISIMLTNGLDNAITKWMSEKNVIDNHLLNTVFPYRNQGQGRNSRIHQKTTSRWWIHNINSKVTTCLQKSDKLTIWIVRHINNKIHNSNMSPLTIVNYDEKDDSQVHDTSFKELLKQKWLIFN